MSLTTLAQPVVLAHASKSDRLFVAGAETFVVTIITTCTVTTEV
jgi:hypothetical protein